MQELSRRRERWLSWVLAGALLIAGVGGSFVAAKAFRDSVEGRDRNSFNANAASIAGSVSQALQSDMDFTSMTKAVVDINPQATNAQLRQWYKALDADGRYPGVVALGFIAAVPANGLDSYESEVLADPAAGTAVPFRLFPGGARPNYCFVRLEDLEIQHNPLVRIMVFPPGADLCSLMAPTFNRSLATGDTQMVGNADFIRVFSADLGYFPPSLIQSLEQNEAQLLPMVENTTFTITPVYRDGTHPRSEVERRSDLLGWTLGAYWLNTATDEAVATQKGWSVSLSLPEDGHLQTVAHSGPTQTTGYKTTVPVGGEVPGELTVSQFRSPDTFTDFLLAFGGGLALTLLLCALVIVLGTSRRRALELVDQRTGELKHQALHDALTNLPNRTLILDRATQMLARGERNHTVATALFVDLDNFKDINDTLGHAAGDEFLRAVAERLAAALRKGDTIGRLGGDEFVLLAEDAAPGNPESIAERIFKALEEPFQIGPSTRYRIGASIGIASASSGSASDLLRDADIALYEAKASGKNRHVVFRASMHEVVESRFELDMALRKAVEHQEFFVVYQPVFSVVDPVTIGVEALVRWRHPTRGVVPPDQFIPLLEESGMIIPVGRWVAEQACMQVARWHAEGFRLTVAVNVSTRQLEDPNFVADIDAILKASGIDPGDLTLEITEGALIRDPDQTVSVLEQVKHLGVRLAIDDFGTGYSSMSYLQRLPVDILKIDRSFISDMASPETAALVRTFVQLGDTLGLETVAEGIEERSQLESLQVEGCSAGQGYLFSRPLEAADVSTFLEAHRQVQAGV